MKKIRVTGTLISENLGELNRFVWQLADMVTGHDSIQFDNLNHLAPRILHWPDCTQYRSDFCLMVTDMTKEQVYSLINKIKPTHLKFTK